MIKTIGIIVIALLILTGISVVTVSLTTKPAVAPAALPSTLAAQEEQTITVYMVKLGDNGPLGCGDTLVAIDRQIPKTQAVLRAAIDELLSLKRSEFPNAEVYSGLFSSSLTTDSVTLNNGNAIIKLTGTISLGGVCDSPRVESQLTETAKQFPTVKEVEIYINEKPLKDILSEKG
jgi:hypothetical protein